MNIQMQIFKNISFKADDEKMQEIEIRSQAKEISQFCWVSKIFLAVLKKENGMTLDPDELKELFYMGKCLGDWPQLGYWGSKDLSGYLPRKLLALLANQGLLI